MTSALFESLTDGAQSVGLSFALSLSFRRRRRHALLRFSSSAHRRSCPLTHRHSSRDRGALSTTRSRSHALALITRSLDRARARANHSLARSLARALARLRARALPHVSLARASRDHRVARRARRRAPRPPRGAIRRQPDRAPQARAWSRFVFVARGVFQILHRRRGRVSFSPHQIVRFRRARASRARTSAMCLFCSCSSSRARATRAARCCLGFCTAGARARASRARIVRFACVVSRLCVSGRGISAADGQRHLARVCACAAAVVTRGRRRVAARRSNNRLMEDLACCAEFKV